MQDARTMTPREFRCLRRRARPLLVLAGVLAGANVSAQSLSDLRVVPNPAASGTPIEARFQRSGCLSTAPAVLTREGNVITIGFPTGQTLPCGVPPPPSELAIPIGAFGPGLYTVRAPAQQVAGSPPTLIATFSVFSNPNAIPSSTPAWLAAMVLLTMAIGALVAQRRR
jgi:hypothetical protein